MDFLVLGMYTRYQGRLNMEFEILTASVWKFSSFDGQTGAVGTRTTIFAIPTVDGQRVAPYICGTF